MKALGFLIKQMALRELRVYAARHLDDAGTHVGYRWSVQAKVPPPDPRPEAWDDQWTDDWEPAAGTMSDAIKESTLLLHWGIAGKLSGHDYLECDTCGEVQMCQKKSGTPSARKKCIMTVKCGGYMRRMFEVFQIEKAPRKTKARKAKSEAPKKQRGHSQAIRDEALALLDQGMSQSQAARIMALRHPDTCSKLTVSTISTWKLARNRALQSKVA